MKGPVCIIGFGGLGRNVFRSFVRDWLLQLVHEEISVEVKRQALLTVYDSPTLRPVRVLMLDFPEPPKPLPDDPNYCQIEELSQDVYLRICHLFSFLLDEIVNYWRGV